MAVANGISRGHLSPLLWLLCTPTPWMPLVPSEHTIAMLLLYHTCHNIPIVTTSFSSLPTYHTTTILISDCSVLRHPSCHCHTIAILNLPLTNKQKMRKSLWGCFPPPFFKHINYLSWSYSQNIPQTFYRISIPEDLVIPTDWNVSILSWHFATAKNVTEWFLRRQYSVEMVPKYAERFMVKVASRKCFLVMASSKISAISVHAACIAGMPVFCVKGRHQWGWGGFRWCPKCQNVGK